MFLRIIFVLLLGFSSAPATAAPAAPLQLAGDAPDSYTVRRGDTLWGISGRFLREPWRWPELWRMNREQVGNPHRIYPGQVLALDRSGPTLRVATPERLQPRVHEEGGARAIPSIPHHVIAPYLSEPLIVEEGALDAAPKIVATQEDRVFVGAGNTIYATGVESGAKSWQVYRPAQPVKDPRSGEVLGYEAVFLGSARLVRPGAPATLEIVSSKQEVGLGDRLVAAVTPDVITHAPHAPERDVEGRIVKIYEGVGETGRSHVVTLGIGRAHGLEPGHVLAIHRQGRAVTYSDPGEHRREDYTLPEERFGLVFVFRTFDRLAYALVMDASRPVTVGDSVRKP